MECSARKLLGVGADGAHRCSKTYGGMMSFQIDDRVKVGGSGYVLLAGYVDDSIDPGPRPAQILRR